MNQKKIGAFIANCRKEKDLTQMQLAEQLEVTSQAVSKWETGRGMPDVSLLQPLCEILDISLNELFSGERIGEEEYKGKAEENITKLFREKQIANLKPVKYVTATLAKVTFCVAMVELLIGLVAGLIEIYGVKELETSTMKIMFINAAVWLGMFLVSFGKLKLDKKKLEKQKQMGECLEAEIEEILPAAWIRVANYTCFRVRCSYGFEGREYKAMSSYYILTPFVAREDIQAYVYVDKDNPAKCGVELFQKA